MGARFFDAAIERNFSERTMLPLLGYRRVQSYVAPDWES